MNVMKVSAAVVIGVLCASSALAADVRPGVVNVAPTASATTSAIGADGRVGVKRSRKSSDLTSAAVPVAILGVAAAGAGVAAALSGRHGSSNGSPTVSPS